MKPILPSEQILAKLIRFQPVFKGVKPERTTNDDRAFEPYATSCCLAAHRSGLAQVSAGIIAGPLDVVPRYLYKDN
jgi:hypothetical protein